MLSPLSCMSMRLKLSVSSSRKMSQSPLSPLGRFSFHNFLCHWPCDIVLSYLPPYVFLPVTVNSSKAESVYFSFFFILGSWHSGLACMPGCSLNICWKKRIRLGVERRESWGVVKKSFKIWIKRFDYIKLGLALYFNKLIFLYFSVFIYINKENKAIW